MGADNAVATSKRQKGVLVLPSFGVPLVVLSPAPVLFSALDTGGCCAALAAAAAARALPATGGLTATFSFAPRSITGMLALALSAASAASFSLSAAALAACASAISAFICAIAQQIEPLWCLRFIDTFKTHYTNTPRSVQDTCRYRLD